MTSEQQMMVVVHKASLPLCDGESVGDFTDDFRMAAVKQLKLKLNLGSKDYSYMVELFGDSAVFCIYYDQSAPNPHQPSMEYYSLGYTRDITTAKFTFDSVEEVERVVSFEPVDMTTTKGVETAKAVWTAAAANNLPDSAFLHISPGGKKDPGGKTTPRGLRHFPVRGPDGKLDGPHLRNALARIPQAKIPPAAAAAATKLGQKLLAEFDKTNKPAAKTTKAAEPVEKSLTPAKFAAFAASKEPTVEQLVEAVHKSAWSQKKQPMFGGVIFG